jgi:propionyl-CoA synthetase
MRRARTSTWDYTARSFMFSADEYARFPGHKHGPSTIDFWLEQSKAVDWFTPPSRAFEWREDKKPLYQWFPDGRLNLCHNMLDRHLPLRSEQAAIHFDSAVGGNSRTITYGELHKDVTRFAGYLQAQLGVQKGDCVLLYMPMIPELMVAMLACARIGAVHSVVFGGFASTCFELSSAVCPLS